MNTLLHCGEGKPETSLGDQVLSSRPSVLSGTKPKTGPHAGKELQASMCPRQWGPGRGTPRRRTALVALPLFYLQGQVQGPDGKVDGLGIHSSNLLRDS